MCVIAKRMAVSLCGATCTQRMQAHYNSVILLYKLNMLTKIRQASLGGKCPSYPNLCCPRRSPFRTRQVIGTTNNRNSRLQVQSPFQEETRATSCKPRKSEKMPVVELPYSQHKWKWRGHNINYATAGCGKPIILVHGFGLSSSHYRKTIAELSKNYKVYAIDLLGFGASSKPTTVQYSMELWRDLLLDFMTEFTSGSEGGATIVGNSIGGLACLMTAAEAPDGAVRGCVLLNTAGAMNNKGILSDWRIIVAYPLLLFIDFILSVPAFAQVLFSKLATKDNIKGVLKSVYCNKEAVTDELVELIYAPSVDAGARDVFVSVITGPPGPKPYGLVLRIECPLLVLWGDKDTLTPPDGPVGKFFQALPDSRPNTTFTFLPDVGHCIHDDRPELVHAQLVPWLQKLHS